MRKEIIAGFLGSIGLLLFYFLVMGVSLRSWSATISQFKDLWYWMIILAAGFGTQIGLFVYLKKCIKKPGVTNYSKIVAATSTGTSVVSMVACCAHHLSDVLPIIGLSGAAVFLTKYQIPLIILGILTNVSGIIYMVYMIRKVKLSHVPSSDGRIRDGVLLLVVFGVIVLIFVLNLAQGKSSRSIVQNNSFSSQENKGGDVSVTVKPKILKVGEKPAFEMEFNTHSVDLLFDISKINSLVDDKGNILYVELIIKDIAGVSERKFRWNI